MRNFGAVDTFPHCEKCGETSGNNWGQCEGKCPMKMSPHFDAATAESNAAAAAYLAETQCPPDVIEWGKAHGLPTWAEVTWQAGFLQGWKTSRYRK